MATGGASTGSGFAHRPHLDGLRALAVYLVVAFHAGLGSVSGGFIGVDVFFVLSGYLVTSLLVRDLWGPGGSLSLGSFYARRARRLLPAALTVLVATALVYRLAASPAALDDALRSFQAAALYVSNWHFIRESTDYFADDLGSNPVLHYWSLSIEEQFYLVWPVAVLALTWLRRRLRRGEDVARAVVLVLGVASACWALYLARTDLPRAYYGSDTRAYELLAGALLAMTPRISGAYHGVRQHRRWGWTAGGALVGLVVLSSALIEVGPITRGVAATVLTVAVLASLERTTSTSLVRRSLSAAPVTYLGRISYGTYLWHWPVIVILSLVLPTSPLATLAITFAVATGLAAASSELLELPLRRSPRLDLRPRPVVVVGLAASLLVGLFVLPRIGREPATEATAPVVTRTGDAPDVGLRDLSGVDWKFASQDRTEALDCLDKPVEGCLVASGGGPRVVVLGDSHAIMIRPALEEIAKRRDWTLYGAGVNGCSWMWGAVKDGGTPEVQASCARAQDDLYQRIVPEIDPDLVILIQRAPDDPNRMVRLTGTTDELRALEPPELLRRTAARALNALRKDGRTTVVIEPIPVASAENDPLECLSKAETPAACRYTSFKGRTPLEGFLEAEQDDLIHVADIDHLVCPYLPICDPIIDGIVVKWDETHLTATYARSISEPLEAVLEQSGALPG